MEIYKHTNTHIRVCVCVCDNFNIYMNNFVHNHIDYMIDIVLIFFSLTKKKYGNARD